MVDQFTPSLADRMTEVMDKLLANGGHTVKGVADELERQGLRGKRGDSNLCIVAMLLRKFLPGVEIRVSPINGANIHDCCSTCSTPRVQGVDEDEAVTVELPSVLNDLAVRFDQGYFPRLSE